MGLGLLLVIAQSSAVAPFVYPWRPSGRAALRRVARDEEVPLLDLSELNGREALFADHVHVRREGSDTLAARFAAFLDSLLSSP